MRASNLRGSAVRILLLRRTRIQLAIYRRNRRFRRDDGRIRKRGAPGLASERPVDVQAHIATACVRRARRGFGGHGAA